MGAIHVPKMRMDDPLIASRTGSLEGVCLPLTEGGIKLTCAPKSTKNLQPEDQSAQCFFKGQPLRLLQVVGFLISHYIRSMTATLLFQGHCGTHLYALSPNLAW